MGRIWEALLPTVRSGSGGSPPLLGALLRVLHTPGHTLTSPQAGAPLTLTVRPGRPGFLSPPGAGLHPPGVLRAPCQPVRPRWCGVITGCSGVCGDSKSLLGPSSPCGQSLEVLGEMPAWFLLKLTHGASVGGSRLGQPLLQYLFNEDSLFLFSFLLFILS